MNDRERRRYEMLVRVNKFGADNAGDFSGVATTQFDLIKAKVGEIETKTAEQAGAIGETGMGFDVKATARENLRDLLSATARTTRSIEYEIDGFSELFHLPRNMTDADMLATGRAFATKAGEAGRAAKFKDYALSDDIVADLTAVCDGFEAAMAATGTGIDERVAATAEIAELIRLGVRAVRILDPIVRNVYDTNTGKTAAWASASHIEKDPEKKKP